MGKDGREGEDGRQAHLEDFQVETTGLESGIAGNSSGGHCFEGHLDDGEFEHPDRYIMNIRIYLGREFRSLR